VPSLPRFSDSYSQVVAWGDMDSFGHVNNVAYAKYFESARAVYFSEKSLWLTAGQTKDPASPLRAEEGPVLIHVELNYRKQVFYPATLEVTLGLLRIAKKGFDIGCSMWWGEDLVVDGMATILWYDFAKKKVTEIPPQLGELPIWNLS